MNEQLAAGLRLSPFVEALSREGLSGADLEVDGDILILRLPAESRSRLLRDGALRDRLVSLGKALGLARLAIELTP